MFPINEEYIIHSTIYQTVDKPALGSSRERVFCVNVENDVYEAQKAL